MPKIHLKIDSRSVFTNKLTDPSRLTFSVLDIGREGLRDFENYAFDVH